MSEQDVGASTQVVEGRQRADAAYEFLILRWTWRQV